MGNAISIFSAASGVPGVCPVVAACGDDLSLDRAHHCVTHARMSGLFHRLNVHSADAQGSYAVEGLTNRAKPAIENSEQM